MKLEVFFSKESGVQPELVAALAGLPDDQKFFRERKQRHPFSLVSMALVPYISAMEACFKLLENVARNSLIAEDVGKDYEDLLGKYQGLLHAAEAFDDTLNILVSGFFENDKAAAKSVAMKQFRSKSKSYRGKLGRTINALKHRNGYLRPIVMFGDCRGEYSIAPGVYVEGVLANGAIGPDEEVHFAGNTGFSLVRELRYYFSHLFFLCHWAESALRSAGFLEKDHEISRSFAKIDGFESLARGLANSRLCIFPDEVFRKNPEVSFFKDASGEGLRVEFKENRRARSIMSGRIKSSFRGDSISRSYKLPYMGTKVNEEMYADLLSGKVKLE